MHCNDGNNTNAYDNDCNDTNEYDNDTNGRNDENSKEDSENIADNVHQNNGEQGHLQFSSKRVKVINDCDEESESFNLMEDVYSYCIWQSCGK